MNAVVALLLSEWRLDEECIDECCGGSVTVRVETGGCSRTTE